MGVCGKESRWEEIQEKREEKMIWSAYRKSLKFKLYLLYYFMLIFFLFQKTLKEKHIL